jgi:hypothetical protein
VFSSSTSAISRGSPCTPNARLHGPSSTSDATPTTTATTSSKYMNFIWMYQYIVHFPYVWYLSECLTASVVQWSEFLAANLSSRAQLPAPPDFLSSMCLEQGPLSPCEDKWGATWKKSSGSGLKNRLPTIGDPLPWLRDTPLSTELGTKFRQQVAVAQSV